MGTLARAWTWSLSLWRLASGRIRADWRFLLGVWLLLACATTLLASGVLYGDAVAVGSLRAAVRAAPLAQQGVLVESSLTPAQVLSADGSVRADLRAGLGPPGGEVALQLRSSSLVPVGTPVASAAQHLTLLESATDVQAHAALTAGRWPRPGRTPLEVALPEAAARALGLAIGDQVPLADASRPDANPDAAIVTLTVVGLYRPDAADPYWAGDPLDVSGAATISGGLFRGPFLVDQSDLLAPGRFNSLDARWRAIPSLEALTADAIAPLRARLDALPDQVRGLFPAGGSVNVTLELGRLLDTLDRSLQVARAAVLLLTLQFAVVAVYAVLLIAGMLADRRRAEVGLLRSRGASSAHVVALAFGESFLLAIPASLVAPLLAVELVELLGRVGPLASTGAVTGVTIDATTIAAVAATGILAAIALTLPALAAGAEVAGIRAVLGRPVARTLAQRLGIDVALTVLAALAIWQLRAYGAPLTTNARGVLGLDPLLVAAPAFGLLAGAVLATRLVPRLAEIGEHWLARSRGLISSLGVRQIARRPLRYTRAALLLMLASALGTFGASYAWTWTGSQAAQADYQAGADVRVSPIATSELPAWALGGAYRAIPGVTGAMPVATQDLSVGQVVRAGRLLALDAATAPRIALLPSGSEASALPAGLARLAAERPATGGLVLPIGTRRLRLTVDAGLTEETPPGQFPIPADYRGLSLSATVQDSDGQIETFQSQEAAPALFEGAGQEVIIPLDVGSGPTAAAGPTQPLELLGIEVSLANPYPYVANPITGSLDVASLAASADLVGGAWTTSGGPTSLAAWRWQSPADSGYTDLGHGPHVVLTAASVQASLGSASLRLTAPNELGPTIPVLASETLLAVTGSHVGQTVTVSSAGQSLDLGVVAAAPEFPTLDPSLPFAVVDGPTLALQGYLSAGSTSGPADWWLSTTPSQARQVVTAVSSAPFRSQTVVSRDAILAALERDPIGLGTLGALLLGSLAAAAFASLGFLVGASVSARERLTEFALLRALGLSGRQLAGWLAAEQAFLLGLGLLAGTGVGLLLAWAILPSTLLSATGAPVVPVPVIVIPWTVLAGTDVGAMLVLVVTMALVGRPLPGRRLAAVLRSVGE
jgi:FtsX-like permease family